MMKKQLIFAASSVAILMAASSALAAGANRNPGVNAPAGRTAETITPSHRPILLAEARNLCGKQPAVLSVETKDFFVSICGDETNPTDYVGVSKKNRQTIRLPLTGQNHGIYVAENKGTRYMVDTNRLRVIQGRKTIVDQPVLNFK
jgi:hypothetical protein